MATSTHLVSPLRSIAASRRATCRATVAAGMSFHTGADFELGGVHRRRGNGIEHVRPDDLSSPRRESSLLLTRREQIRATCAHSPFACSTRASPAASPREDRAAAQHTTTARPRRTSRGSCSRSPQTSRWWHSSVSLSFRPSAHPQPLSASLSLSQPQSVSLSSVLCVYGVWCNVGYDR